MSSIDFGYTPILVDHVAQQLHDRYCFMHQSHRGFTDPVPHGGCMAVDDHAWIREAGFLVASMLPKMGELFDVIRADERRRVSATYFCPTSGEMESPCHGGFDICCDKPELHRETE